jgi:S1-C subfamily serine protease
LILELDGQPIESPEDVFDLLAHDRVGKQVPLKIHRGGGVIDVPVTATERPKTE